MKVDKKRVTQAPRGKIKPEQKKLLGGYLLDYERG